MFPGLTTEAGCPTSGFSDGQVGEEVVSLDGTNRQMGVQAKISGKIFIVCHTWFSLNVTLAMCTNIMAGNKKTSTCYKS